MKAIIGLAVTLIGICSSFGNSVESLVTQAFPVVIVLTADLAIGAFAIRDFRKVNRKAAALTRKQAHSTTDARRSETRREMPPSEESTVGCELDFT
jgi:hypothetical protein